MGLVRTLQQIFSELATRVPTCTTGITAEPLQFHGAPPRVVAYLPDLGREEYTEAGDTQPGHKTSDSHQGQLAERICAVEFHVWMETGSVTADGIEIPNDEEDPNEGTVWLVQELINAIQETVPGGFELGPGGWLSRTTSNLGFSYVLQVRFKFAVYRTARVTQNATISTLDVRKS